MMPHRRRYPRIRLTLHDVISIVAIAAILIGIAGYAKPPPPIAPDWIGPGKTPGQEIAVHAERG